MKLSSITQNFKYIIILLFINLIIRLLMTSFPEAFNPSTVLPYQLWINILFLFIFILPDKVAKGIL